MDGSKSVTIYYKLTDQQNHNRLQGKKAQAGNVARLFFMVCLFVLDPYPSWDEALIAVSSSINYSLHDLMTGHKMKWLEPAKQSTSDIASNFGSSSSRSSIHLVLFALDPTVEHWASPQPWCSPPSPSLRTAHWKYRPSDSYCMTIWRKQDHDKSFSSQRNLSQHKCRQ